MSYTPQLSPSLLQRLLLTAGSGVISLMDPRRGDMVATFGELTAGCILPGILASMKKSAEGQKILKEMPRITDATIDPLRSLPERTLGREYCRFLDRLKTSPDHRPPVQYIANPDLVYVMQRYRETHDLYHTILDMPTTILGEVTVKWWEGIQLGLPMCLLGGCFGAVRLYPKQREKYLKEYLPWVLRNAPHASYFMAIYWEHYWDQPIETLRRRLNIEEPPGVIVKAHS